MRGEERLSNLVPTLGKALTSTTTSHRALSQLSDARDPQKRRCPCAAHTMRLRQLATLAAPLLAATQSPPQILVYYATAGYYHQSIPAAMSAIQQIGQNTSLFNATFSKDENLFTPTQLEPFKAIVFLSNSDQVLTSDGEAAFADWLTKGGSLVGLHAGTACLFNDTAFGVAMGARVQCLDSQLSG